MIKTDFPARLHVLVAPKCSRAIVIRRGPSKHTATYLWDLETDKFEQGQWLKGRIYERRSDIAPDGKHWIYFAMNGKWSSPALGSWSCVAKPPFLKAVTLYPKGDCWHGGGLFLNNKEYWLNGPHADPKGATSSVKRRGDYQPPENYGGECLHVYYNRLQRDGWRLEESKDLPGGSQHTVFSKQAPHGWVLMKVAHAGLNTPDGRGCYWDRHLVRSPKGVEVSEPDWEWAEVHGNRVVYAEKGILYSIDVPRGEQLPAADVIHNFNDYRFEEIQAPY